MIEYISKTITQSVPFMKKYSGPMNHSFTSTLESQAWSPSSSTTNVEKREILREQMFGPNAIVATEVVWPYGPTSEEDKDKPFGVRLQELALESGSPEKRNMHVESAMAQIDKMLNPDGMPDLGRDDDSECSFTQDQLNENEDRLLSFKASGFSVKQLYTSLVTEKVDKLKNRTKRKAEER